MCVCVCIKFTFKYQIRRFIKKNQLLWRVSTPKIHSDSAKSIQPCLTFDSPVDCSPPGSSVHGIFQASILEWVPISVSKGSSLSRY